MDLDLNIDPKTIKLLKEKIGGHSYDFDFR